MKGHRYGQGTGSRGGKGGHGRGGLGPLREDG